MPKEWQGLTFRLHYRGAWLEITTDEKNQAKVSRLAGDPVEVEVNGEVTTI
ncbi:MAG: glycosyl hydrolase family 65 protein [Coprococcus comes]